LGGGEGANVNVKVHETVPVFREAWCGREYKHTKERCLSGAESGKGREGKVILNQGKVRGKRETSSQKRETTQGDRRYLG